MFTLSPLNSTIQQHFPWFAHRKNETNFTKWPVFHLGKCPTTVPLFSNATANSSHLFQVLIKIEEVIKSLHSTSSCQQHNLWHKISRCIPWVQLLIFFCWENYAVDVQALSHCFNARSNKYVAAKYGVPKNTYQTGSRTKVNFWMQ